MTASTTPPDPSPSPYIDPAAGALLVDMYGEPVAL